MGPWGKGALATPILLTLAVLAACNGGTSPPLTPVLSGAALCQPLAQAERFRYTFAYSLDSPQPEGDVDEATVVGESTYALKPTTPDFSFSQQYEGAVENPDKLDVAVRTGVETGEEVGEIQMIFIGNDQWVRLDDQWSRAQGQPMPFPPVEVCNAIASGLDLTGLTPTADTVDGVDAVRYEVENVETDTAARLWTEQSDQGRIVQEYTVTVWLSEKGGVPVRMESRGVGTIPGGRELTVELKLEPRDINAADIKVEPPS